MITIFGVFQGSGSDPAIWLAVSLVLIEVYVKKFSTNSTPNPIATDFITKVIDAFVNDTDLWMFYIISN